jgi:general secretion pathway protein C
VFETLLHKGVEPVRWLIVIGIAYTLANGIWSFFQTPVSSTLEPRTSEASKTTRAPANVNWILAKNLFGEAGAAPVANGRDDEPTVQTRLPLELQSVFVAEDTTANLSAAIVAQRGKPGLRYKVGANLPGNAELIEVRTDRIILRRAGVKETLMFPKIKSQLVAEASESEETDDSDEADESKQRPRPRSSETRGGKNSNANDNTQASDSTEDPQDLVNTYREKLTDDATSTLNELGIESVDSSGAAGYRIADMAQSPYLRQTGLQSGDVILSVNGRPVGDIERDQLEIENIMAQGSARIEVQRGSRRFFITASLK